MSSVTVTKNMRCPIERVRKQIEDDKKDPDRFDSYFNTAVRKTKRVIESESTRVETQIKVARKPI